MRSVFSSPCHSIRLNGTCNIVKPPPSGPPPPPPHTHPLGNLANYGMQDDARYLHSTIREWLFNTGGGGEGWQNIFNDSTKELHPPSWAWSNPPQHIKKPKLTPTQAHVWYILKLNCLSWKQHFQNIYYKCLPVRHEQNVTLFRGVVWPKWPTMWWQRSLYWLQ